MSERQKYREAIMAFAESEIGVSEFPKDSNKVKYNDWYFPEFTDKEKKKKHPYFVNSLPYAWCATFCSYAYYQGGFAMPPIDTELGCHYVPTLYYKAKAMNWTTKEPKLGDLVLFDFKHNDSLDIQHIGLFHSWIEKGISFYSIDGNTSDKGSQSNGGSVLKKVRYMANVIQFVNLIDNIK